MCGERRTPGAKLRCLRAGLLVLSVWLLLAVAFDTPLYTHASFADYHDRGSHRLRGLVIGTPQYVGEVGCLALALLLYMILWKAERIGARPGH